MRPTTDRHTLSWLRSAALVSATAVLVIACGSAGASPTPAPTPVATPAPTATPVPTKGPPTSQLTIVGDPAIAGTFADAQVQCNFPTVTGPQIVLYRQTNPIGVNCSDGRLDESQLRLGLGRELYLERDFSGTGVTGFDAADGAQFDSTLDTGRELRRDRHARRNHVDQGQRRLRQPDHGDVDPYPHRRHRRGSAHRHLPQSCSGSNADHAASSGSSVSVVGVATVGMTPTRSSSVTGTATGFTVAQEPQTGSVYFYINSTAGSATLTATGVTISGQAAEQQPKGSTATTHTVTVAGSAACGAFVNS